MKFTKAFSLLTLLALTVALSGCRRSGSDVWEDTKSGSRHINRGFRSLGGKCGDSRAVCSSADFLGADDEWVQTSRSGGDFVPLSDQPPASQLAMSEFVAQQPSQTPGDPGSSLPGIDSFRDPATIPALAGIFKNIHFDYNDYLIRGPENAQIMRQVTDYMRQHPGAYVFVEGHTDERGPEAYNLALGSRRANAVRSELIQNGVNPDNLFTISYGKERPLVMESHEEGWAKNRRAEFKIYQR